MTQFVLGRTLRGCEGQGARFCPHCNLQSGVGDERFTYDHHHPAYSKTAQSYFSCATPSRIILYQFSSAEAFQKTTFTEEVFMHATSDGFTHQSRQDDAF